MCGFIDCSYKQWDYEDNGVDTARLDRDSSDVNMEWCGDTLKAAIATINGRENHFILGAFLRRGSVLLKVCFLNSLANMTPALTGI